MTQLRTQPAENKQSMLCSLNSRYRRIVGAGLHRPAEPQCSDPRLRPPTTRSGRLRQSREHTTILGELVPRRVTDRIDDSLNDATTRATTIRGARSPDLVRRSTAISSVAVALTSGGTEVHHGAYAAADMALHGEQTHDLGWTCPRPNTRSHRVRSEIRIADLEEEGRSGGSGRADREG